MEKIEIMTREEFKHFETIDAMYDKYLLVAKGFNRLVDICNDSSERIAELVIERDNLSKGVQKLIGERDDLIERHNVYTSALNKDLADKAAKIELMEKEIEGRKAGYVSLKTQMDILKKECDRYANDVMEKCTYIDTLKQDIEDMEEETEKLKKTIDAKDEEISKRCKDVISQSGTICNLKKELDARGEEIRKLEEKVKHQRENLDGINRTLEIKIKENESLIAVRNNQDKEIEAHESENARLTEKIMELRKELDKTCRTKELDLKGHNRREMALVNELADKNDEIKSLKEENSYLKSEIKQKQNIIKKAYERYSDDIIKTRKDVLEVAYRDIEKDNGYVGFKLYVKSALIEAKGDKNEANEIITEAVRSAYTEWDKTQKENEKTIKKAIKEVMNKKYGYAGEIAFRIRSEVDKKRIVDIGEGAEKILGVSRELFDAAIKALVDDGYQEIIGRIPQATNSYVYMDMHVLATPDVETKETANAENIKTLDFDIPCGEDAIE